MDIENEELLERLTFLFENNQDKANHMKKKLTNTKETIKTIRNNIFCIIDYESFFNPKGENLQNLQKFSKNLNFKEICDLQGNEDIIDYINKTKDEALAYNEILNSKCFSSIYNDLSSKSPNKFEENKNKAKELFLSLKQMFDSENINNISKDLLNVIFENVKDFDKEIKFLKKYFKKDNVDTKDLEDMLYIIAKKDDITSIIKSFLKIIDSFNIKQTDYYSTILQISDLLNNTSIDAISIKKKCNAIGYNYKDKSRYLSIIEIMNRKENFLPFLLQKKEEEIRHLIEFVDDIDGELVKQGDIKNLEKVIDFINDLQINTLNKDDKTFFEYLKQLSEDNVKYKDIEIYFENVINNINEFEELYLKAFDKNEFTRKKIESLYTSSTYTIELKEGKIKCEIQYGNKFISLEEVLELRDRILLKKKQLNSNDPRNFNKKSNIYSKKVNRIEELINYLKKLSFLGYPNDIQYIIKLIEAEEGNEDTALQI